MNPSTIAIQHPQSDLDVAAMLDMLNRVYHRDCTAGQGMDREFPHLFAPENWQHLYYVALDGQVVSMVGVYPQTLLLQGHPLQVWSIGCVATDPLYEKRGLATQILQQVFDDGHDARVPLTLISGERGLYRRLDAVPIGAMIEATGEQDSWKRLRSSMTFCAMTVREIPAQERAGMASSLVSLYRDQAQRFSRTANHMATLFNALWFARPHYDQRLLVVEADGTLAGYVVAYRSLRHPDQVTVMEWAGSPLAILPSLSDMINRFGSRTLTVSLPMRLAWLGQELGAHDILTKTLPLQGTVRALNVSALVSQLEPIIREHYNAALVLDESPDGLFRGTGPDGADLRLARSEIPGYLFNPKPGGLALPMAWTHDLNFV